MFLEEITTYLIQQVTGSGRLKKSEMRERWTLQIDGDHQRSMMDVLERYQLRKKGATSIVNTLEWALFGTSVLQYQVVYIYHKSYVYDL